MNGTYQIGDVVFGNWVILREIGRGSFGTVYVVGHQDDHSFTSALKVITVPHDEAEVRIARDEGMDYQELSQHFHGIVREIEQEFKLMFQVKGSGHVVAYEDHKVETHKDPYGRELLGWDILIRMELLTPLLDWAYEHPMSRKDIIRLGIHLCTALEMCQSHGILHRDIKPENIFVSKTGDFKLGDFGVARTMEKTMSGMSKKGTYNYMAPEVYKGEDCNFKADVYSVGIVMYRLLNNNRLPFLPAAPQPVTRMDREQALARRMKAERLPLPHYAQDTLGEIVIKAADYDAARRYTPGEMRQVLEQILRMEGDGQPIYPDADDQRKRREVGELSRSLEPSVTPRMTDRTVHTPYAEATVSGTYTGRLGSLWGNLSVEDPTSGTDRGTAGTSYGTDGSGARQQPQNQEPEERTESTVSAWSHRSMSQKKATMEDRMQAASDEAHIAIQKAASGSMEEAIGAAKKASASAFAAAKLAKENRAPRNEKEAQATYDKAHKELEARKTERQTLEKMTDMDPQLKAEMMRDAAKAEMEAAAKEAKALSVLEEFRQKRLAEEEKKRQEEAARQKQWEAEENLRRMNRAAEETKRQKSAQTVPAVRKTKKSSGKGALEVVVFLGFAIVIGLLIVNTLNGNIGGGMAKKAVDIVQNHWDTLYASLDVEGELNYQSSSLEEIGQVLDEVGFQFLDQEYTPWDEVVIDESNGRRLHAMYKQWITEEMYEPIEVLVSEGSWGSRTVIFRGIMDEFYQGQSQGEIPTFLPTRFVLGGTTPAEFDIDDEMIQWIQKGNDTTVGNWEVYTYGSTDDYGNGECSIVLTNEEEKKELDLKFFITPESGKYVLHEIWIQFPEDPAIAWTSVAEALSQNLYQSLDMTEKSGINYQTDSLEDIAGKLEENGASFDIPEGSDSKFYQVSEENVSVPNTEFRANFPDFTSITLRDEYYDEVVVRFLRPSVLYWEDYANNSHLQPGYLIPGKTTMEELGITEEMLEAVKKADGGKNDGYFAVFGDLRVYQCLYKNEDPDAWYMSFDKINVEAAYNVGKDYYDITLKFDKVDEEWVLDYWYYAFAMEQAVSEEAATE